MTAYRPQLINIIYPWSPGDVLKDTPSYRIERFEDHLLNAGTFKINGIYVTLELVEENVQTHGQQIVAITRRFVNVKDKPRDPYIDAHN